MRRRRRAPLSIFAVDHGGNDLAATAIQFDLRDFCRPPEIATGCDSTVEEMGIEFGTIDLKSLDTSGIAGADFDAVVESLIRRFTKPQPQTLFREMFMTEIVRQTQDPGQVTAADLGR